MARKLKSNRGASLIVAMLALLICAMVGAVVVASASAGIQHVEDRHEEQQEYFSLSSAAKLLTEGMSHLTYTSKVGDIFADVDDMPDFSIGRYPLYVYRISNKHDSEFKEVPLSSNLWSEFKSELITPETVLRQYPTDQNNPAVTTDDSEAAKALSATIKALASEIQTVEKNSPGSAIKKTREIDVTASEDSAVFPVHVTIEMSQDYSVKMTLQVIRDKETKYVPFVLEFSANTMISEDNRQEYAEKQDLLVYHRYVKNSKIRYIIGNNSGQKHGDGNIQVSCVAVTTDTIVTWNYLSIKKGSD